MSRDEFLNKLSSTRVLVPAYLIHLWISIYTPGLFHHVVVPIFQFCLIFFFIFSPRIENHSLELPHHWSSWRPTNSLQPRKEPRSPVSINLFQFWHKLVTSDDKHWPRCERTPSTSYQPSPGGVYVLISTQGNGRVVLMSNSLKTKSSKPIVDYFMGYIWWWNDDASVSLWEEIFFRGIEDVLWELFSFIHVYICMYISKLILFLKLFKDNWIFPPFFSTS